MDLAASFSPAATERRAGLADAVGRGVVVGVLTLTALALALYLVLGLTWAAQPQLPGLIGHTQVIDVADLVFSTPWDGTEAGFDVIVAIDGAPLPTSPDVARETLRRLAASWVPGDELEITVRRQVGSHDAVASAPAGFTCALDPGVNAFPADAVCTFTATVDYLPLSAVFTWFGVPYLVGLALFVWGAVVYWLRRQDLHARLFAVLCGSMAVMAAGLWDVYSTHRLITLWALAVPMAGGVVGVLALTFPYNLRMVRRWPLARWLPVVVAGVVAVVAEAAMLDPAHRAYFRGLVLIFGFAALSLLALLVVSLRRRARSSSPIEHSQANMVLIGVFLTLAPLLIVVVALVVATLLDAPPLFLSIAAVALFALALPAFLGVALLSRRQIATDRIISRGTTYLILGVAVVLGYALLSAGLSMVLGSAFRVEDPVLITLMVVVIAFALLPLRLRLEAMIDAVYYRRRNTYQQHLESFGHALTKAANLDSVVAAIKEAAMGALAPSHLYIYMLGPDSTHYIACGSPHPESDVRFDADGGVARVLSQQTPVLHLHANQPLPPELITDSARLRVLGVEVLAAMRAHGRVSGFIALGPKRSGGAYVYEDMRFIEGLAEQATLGIERAQVITDLERRVAELDVLSRVSQAVNFTVEFGDLLELVYAQTSKVLDASNFFIALHDASASELYYAFYLQGEERITEREGERWRMGRGLLSEVVRTGQPIRTDDYLAECAKRDVRPREHGFRAWMGVPLNAGATTLGAMAVASATPGFTYTDEQLKVFWAIADTAATAIDKSRLFTETERRARQLAALNQISTRLAQVLEVDELLELIMASAVDILQTASGSLLLIEEDSGGLEFKVATGNVGSLLVGTKLPRGTGLVGTVAERGEPVIVNDVRHDPRWFPGVDQTTDFRTEALMAVPLTVHNRVIGVLEVVNKKDGSIFTEDDVQLLTTFAAQASIAIENTRLYQQTNEALAARVEELRMLARIDRELNAGLEIDRIVELTLDWAMRISSANAGAVANVDPERGLNVMLHYGYGPEAEEILAYPLPSDRGIFGRVVRSGRPELVTRVSLDPDYMPISLNTRAQMVVPLRSGGEVVGVIILDSYSDSIFSENDMELVVRVAEHASPAIANARLYASLKDANEAKSEFVSFVSHELKTPMTSIKGYTDLLLQGAVGDVSQTQSQFLSTIKANIERMATLVSDLADITRIEAGQLRLEVSPIQVRAVLEDTLRGVQNLIEGKNQNLDVQMPDELPMIAGDQARLVQVLTNLLSNAHKYTPEGGTITVGAEVAANVWDAEGPGAVMHFWVRDTGIGMDGDDLNNLFQKFFRSSNPQARQMPGTGLGLNITKNLVELHGGRIWAESALDVGSIFHFTVPLAEEKA